jgi:hypothetical protein
MPRITPKTNWVANDIPIAQDINRIETNSLQAFTDIDAETAARQAAIAAEAGNRQAADTTLQNNINNHVALTGTNAHNATSDNNANSIMSRDLNGRTNISSPIATSHAANKGYVDTADLTLQNNINALKPYNGFNAQNADFPIGSIVLVNMPFVVNNNSGISIYISTDGQSYSITPGGTQLTGQWVCRGGTWAATPYYCIAQRIS